MLNAAVTLQDPVQEEAAKLARGETPFFALKEAESLSHRCSSAFCVNGLQEEVYVLIWQAPRRARSLRDNTISSVRLSLSPSSRPRDFICARWLVPCLRTP